MFELYDVLKQDAFGSIEKGVYRLKDGTQIPAIRRVYTKNLFFKPIALFLAKNEKRALKRLQSCAAGYFPVLLCEHKQFHVRSFIEGASMHKATEQVTPAFFTECKKLLKTMRAVGVVNNDLAKEANWLITPDNKPAISDFQLALCFKNNTRKIFRSLSKEDLRHLLKHKRKYANVTAQEKKVLAKKAPITNIWMLTGKKVHRFITRKILGWEDRVGPEERNI